MEQNPLQHKQCKTCSNILQFFSPCPAPADPQAGTTAVALLTGPQAELALVGVAHLLFVKAALCGGGYGLKMEKFNKIFTNSQILEFSNDQSLV